MCDRQLRGKCILFPAMSTSETNVASNFVQRIYDELNREQRAMTKQTRSSSASYGLDSVEETRGYMSERIVRQFLMD